MRKKTPMTSMRKGGTRYDKSILSPWSYDKSTFGLGGVKRALGWGGQPLKSEKPRVRLTEPARGCNVMKWRKEEVPGFVYLHYFGMPLHKWAEPPFNGCIVNKNGDETIEVSIDGKDQYLHYTIKNGYCCQSKKPLKSQAQWFIRHLGIPGLIQMAPDETDLQTYIRLNMWWFKLEKTQKKYVRRLMGKTRKELEKLKEKQKDNEDLELYDNFRHAPKLKSKIKAFHNNYIDMRSFAYKFNIGEEFDKELPNPLENYFYKRALWYTNEVME